MSLRVPHAGVERTIAIGAVPHYDRRMYTSLGVWIRAVLAASTLLLGNACSGTSSSDSDGGPQNHDLGRGGADGSQQTDGGGGAGGGGPHDFPSSAPWYQDVSGLQPDSDSTDVINWLDAAGGWGKAGLQNGSTARGTFQIDLSDFHILFADSSVVPRSFTPTADFFSPDCDIGTIPVPSGGAVEGYPDYDCTGGDDCHLLVFQGTKLYEMYAASITGGMANGNPFTSECLVVWDLTHDYWQQTPQGYSRGDGCTSTDAAGFPVATLLFTPDEVASGEIKHAIRFILPNWRMQAGVYVHPATHYGAPSANDPHAPPYGVHLRLKSIDISGLTPGAQVVARALMKYGMFLSDGGNIALTAQSDMFTTTKWDGLLGPQDLASIQVTDFDKVGNEPLNTTGQNCTRTPY